MTRPQPRIDLNHGYMRFIRRNQVDRDEYDKVQEQRKSEIRERLGEKKEAPKTNLYVPPHLRQNRQKIASEQPTQRPSSLSRSDSDSQEESEKQKLADDQIRNQVRRRIERTHETVDDICVKLANYSLRESEKFRYSDSSPGKVKDLFTLELTLKSGEKKTISVPRNTQAARLAKSISREHEFDDPTCRNLRLFIEEQLELRLAREEKLLSFSGSRANSPVASLPTSPCSSDSFSSSSSTSPISFSV